MENLLVCFIAQVNLIFGIAGLMWPEKFMSLYGVLMFPWPASYRAIRAHGVVSILGYVLVVGKVLVVGH